jgi:hypothetical protein
VVLLGRYRELENNLKMHWEQWSQHNGEFNVNTLIPWLELHGNKLKTSKSKKIKPPFASSSFPLSRFPFYQTKKNYFWCYDVMMSKSVHAMIPHSCFNFMWKWTTLLKYNTGDINDIDYIEIYWWNLVIWMKLTTKKSLMTRKNMTTWWHWWNILTT